MTQDSQPHSHSGAFAGMHSHDGGALHWHDEFGEHLAEDLSEEEAAARRLDWRKHNVQIVTVGVDIGSATSHLMFSKIFMQLVGEAPHVHSVVVGREILWQSEIMLTPFLDSETIDAQALQRFVAEAYAAVGATAQEVDSGAIILTGEALKRQNALAIGELFARETGKFVTASAGHHLEAVLAANGSGTVARSRRDQRTLLNVDIGGGTTKLAIVRDGEILATAAVAIGARLIVKDGEGRVTRIEEPARTVASSLGIRLEPELPLAAEDEAQIVEEWVDVLAGLIERRPPEGIAAALMLTEPLPADVMPQAITFSGGVSEFIFLRESRDFGDLGQTLAKAIRDAMSNGTIKLPAIIDPNLGIRATAVGTSLFTVQAGINVYVSDDAILPLRNVPVLMPRLEPDSLDAVRVAEAVREAATRADFEEGEQPVALALSWGDENEIEPHQVRYLAQGIRDALPRTIAGRQPILLLTDQSTAHMLGLLLKEDFDVPGPVVALGGVSVSEFDFIDVGEMIHPSEVVPVTIKSLLFAGGLDRRSVKQALIAAARHV
jgi:ethanolamine utilization protein EutA